MIKLRLRASRALLSVALLLAVTGVSACAGGGLRPTDEMAARRALAEQEIALLLRRYGQATDLITLDALDPSRTRAAYRRIFTEQAEIGLQGQRPLVGPDAWLAFVAAGQSTLKGSQHLIGSQVVEVSELPDRRGVGGSATMTSYLLATQIGAQGAITRIHGSYRAQAIHTPGIGWQLSAMTLSLMAVDGAQ